MRRSRLFGVGVALVVAGAGCGSSPAASACQSDRGAEVCMVRTDDGFDLRSKGLMPSSTLVLYVHTSGGGTVPHSIALDGAGGTKGQFGLTTPSGRTQARVAFEGVSALGEPFVGELDLAGVA